MQRNIGAATCLLAVIGLAAQTATAVAQTPPELRNPQVEIKYEEPKNPAHRAIRGRLQERQVLEKLQMFLAPVNLPGKLTVKTDECGSLVAAYKPGSSVTLCYEYVAKVEKDAPPAGRVSQLGQIWLTRDDALVGPVVQVVLHDVARALFDMFKIPIWGSVEFAADHVTAFTMVQFGKQVAWKTVVGTAWFLWDEWDKPVDISSLRPHLAQRYFNLLCIAYANDQVTFGVFIPTNRAQGPLDLPLVRARRCVAEYQKLELAFKKTISDPHVDKAKLQAVRNLDWLKDF